jgi:hypothetical protein
MRVFEGARDGVKAEGSRAKEDKRTDFSKAAKSSVVLSIVRVLYDFDVEMDEELRKGCTRFILKKRRIEW